MTDPKGEIRTDAEGKKYVYVFPEEISEEVKETKRSIIDKVEDLLDDGKLNKSNKKKK